MKTRLIRLAIAAVALATPAMTGSAQAANVAVAVGTGTITPGVPTTGCTASADFEINGSAVNLGTDFGPGPYAFRVVGSSSAACPSFTADSGTATMSGDVTGSLNYSRTVGLITLNGSASVQGSSPRPISITCQVAVLSAPPVTDFAVVCAVTI